MKLRTHIRLTVAACLAFTFHIHAQFNSANLDRENLTQRWELDSTSKKGNFLFVPYKPIYFLLANYTTDPNYSPTSLNPKYDVLDTIPLDNAELKFQISFKTKVLNDLFWGHGSFWVAYTQTSRWQLYNAELSRAFRETNYEPEFILNFATNYKLFGFKGSMAGIAMNHQSNGRAVPLSRSWNRIIVHAGFERKNWEIIARAWHRLEDEDDENPQITSYVGVGDLLVSHSWRHHQFSALMRNNLDVKNNRGAIQFDWAFPVSGHLKGHLQIFNGYGESMIDYNHKQTTIGLGMSLMNWM